MAQKCFRAKGDDSCPYHPTEKVVLRCKQCPGSLVCVSCVTSTHNGHQFVKLNEGIEEKVNTIKQFVKTTETQTIPQLVQEIKSVSQKMKEVVEQYKAEIEEVKKQAEQMKHVVDILMVKDVSRLESLMKNDLKSLKGHQKYLEQLKLKLEDEMKENKSTIQSGNAVVVLDTEADIAQRSDAVIASSPVISVPHFEACRNSEPHIVKGFGELKVKNVKPRSEVLKDDAKVQSKKPLGSGPMKGTGTSYTLQVEKSNTPISVPLKKKILDKPVTLSHFSTSARMYSICPIPNSMAWVCGEDVNQVQKVNKRGEVQQTLDIGERIRRICLHPITGDLYCTCYRGKRIRRINTNTGQTTVVFSTDDQPLSIACTSDNVIVGYDRKVCMYTYQGQRVSSHSVTGFEYNIVFNISVSNQTNRIALACGYGGVIVLDNTLKEVYRCSVEGRYRIQAYSAVFDDSGHLLVGDFNKKEVHILNGSTFQRITTLQTDEMSNLWSIGTQHDMMWTGSGSQIKCLKYIE